MERVRRLLILLLAVGCIFITACSNSADDEKITNDVIRKFAELNQIPRPSGHEKMVSDSIKNWAESQEFEVVQDSHNNLIIDIPATKGMEDKSLVLLQGHMDMVFSQADGLKLDAKSTIIETKNDGKYLSSDGKTSLGADDGIGIAIMECIAEGEMNHGPLRLILTTDEEVGFSGVLNLDKKYVTDSNYMINIDHEAERELVISSASAVDFTFSSDCSFVAPQGNKTVKLTISGLTGGHSGHEIQKGRLNGILAMCDMLRDLKKEKIDFEIQNISGGTAKNAIPTGSEATLCINASDYEKFCKVCNAKADKLKEKYSKTDPKMEFKIENAKKAEQVLSQEDTEKILKLTEKVYDGVYSMTKGMDGLVESSSNTGVLSIEENKVSLVGLIRSSDKKKEDELVEKCEKLAKKLQYDIKIGRTAKGWPIKKNNRLQKLAEEKYKKLFSEEIIVSAIHAGLECGVFHDYNPKMDIISIGPTLKDPHTTKEKVELETIPKIWKLLKDILAEV